MINNGSTYGTIILYNTTSIEPLMFHLTLLFFLLSEISILFYGTPLYILSYNMLK